ncbi:MAG: sigma 54-interacting transcriptional regulator, partial [Pseudomonadota bacterium]|nr:sigma 54-interacting transcriptional regulator [Pseudomonadota bacterium]
GEFERLGSSRTQHADVRVIAATNADLPAAVNAGLFRKDLLYRLNTVELHLPPLRERREDIVPMARSFLAASAQRHQRNDMRLAMDAERALLAYAWPGNVRELRHVMERAALLCPAGVIDAAALTLGTPPAAGDAVEQMTLEQAEAWLVRRALERHADNLQAAADALGITRQALYRRMEKHGLRDADDADAGA